MAGFLRLKTQELYGVEMAELAAEKQFGGFASDKDQHDLARLGKKQVLKVHIHQNRLNTQAHPLSETSALCQCWASAAR